MREFRVPGTRFFFCSGGVRDICFSRTRYAKNIFRVPLKLGGSFFNFFQKLGLRDSAYPLRLFRNVEYPIQWSLRYLSHRMLLGMSFALRLAIALTKMPRGELTLYAFTDSLLGIPFYGVTLEQRSERVRFNPPSGSSLNIKHLS